LLKFYQMDKIVIKDKTFIKYINSSEIDIVVQLIADRINNDYKGKIPIIMIILNGAVIFGSDLLKKLKIDCEVSCIKVSSYNGGTTSNNDVKSIIGLNTNIENRDVIIVEDIVDTGLTIKTLIHLLQNKKAASIKIAAMTYKAEAYKFDYPIEYVALKIPNKFIVGYGLDYCELGRNYKDIYQLHE